MIDRNKLLDETQSLQAKLPKLALRLEESIAVARSIDLTNPSEQELRELEALSARFERALDILVRGCFRAIDRVEGTADGTILDALNRAEKRGLIDTASHFRNMRMVRNEIAHEYLEEEALHIASYIFDSSPALLDALAKTAAYPIQ